MKNCPHTASATDVKNKFGDYLQSVLSQREPLLIEKHGKPVAVMIEYSEWKRSAATQKKHSWSEEIINFSDKLHQKRPRVKSFSAVDLIHELRNEES